MGDRRRVSWYASCVLNYWTRKFKEKRSFGSFPICFSIVFASSFTLVNLNQKKMTVSNIDIVSDLFIKQRSNQQTANIYLQVAKKNYENKESYVLHF